MSYIKNLLSYKDLLRLWTQREIRVRYKQSFLGIAWAILQPLALMIIFSIIFSMIIKVPTKGIPYPIFSYSGVLPWTFFSTALSFGIPALVNNMGLVTKIYFPREILPLASVGAAFFDFLIASSIFIGMFFYFHMQLSWHLLYIPLIITIQVMLTIGVVLPLSALNVFYRDIRFIIPLGIQIWFYTSPVIYPVEQIPERFRTFYALNPMVGIIDSYHQTILYHSPPNFIYLGISFIISLLLLAVGYWFFKQHEYKFADVI